jgi:hypothetical protein
LKSSSLARNLSRSFAARCDSITWK